MQKDIGSLVARNLNGDNEQIRQLVEFIKQNSEQFRKRELRIMDLEDKNDMLQKNLSILAESNKHLEYLIETMRSERAKLLEEIETLKGSSPVVQEVKKSTKKKVKIVSESKHLI